MKFFAKWLGLTWLGVLLTGPTVAQPTWQWANKLQDIIIERYSITHLLTSAGGTTVVIGEYDGPLSLPGFPALPWGYHTVFVARLDNRGNWTSLQALPLEASYMFQLAANGDLLVAGSYSERTVTLGSTTLVNPNPPIGSGGMGAPPRQLFSASFIARYTTAGLWSQIIPFNGPGQIRISAFAADAITGQAVAAGYFKGQVQAGSLSFASLSSRGDEFVIRFNAMSGVFSQVAQITGAGSFFPSSLAVESTGDVVVGGPISSSPVTFGSHTVPGTNPGGYDDIGIARLSPVGIWTQAVQAGGLAHDNLKGLTVAPNGDVVITGDYQYGINFGSIVIPPNPAGRSGGSGSFVARLSPAGQWTQAAAITNADVISLAEGNGLAADGSLLVAGNFYGNSLTFGNSVLTNPSVGSSGFIARISSAGVWTWATSFNGWAGINTTCFSADQLTIAGRMGLNQLQLGSTTLTSATSAEYVALLRGFSTLTKTTALTPAARFTLAPNPATDLIRLTWPCSAATPRSVQLFDGLGREVHRLLLPAHATATTLDVADLKPGLYVVRCEGAAARLVLE